MDGVLFYFLLCVIIVAPEVILSITVVQTQRHFIRIEWSIIFCQVAWKIWRLLSISHQSIKQCGPGKDSSCWSLCGGPELVASLEKKKEKNRTHPAANQAMLTDRSVTHTRVYVARHAGPMAIWPDMQRPFSVVRGAVTTYELSFF